MRAGHHPYFNDQSAAFFYTELDEALQAARDQDKRLFMIVGRPSCGGSRALVEKTLPKEEIGEFLREHFVCLAVHADQIEPAAAALCEGLQRREPTPLCVYLASDGRVLHSTVGGRPAAVFLRDMTEATAR